MSWPTSPTQPYCRCCGKAIPKMVVTHYFGSRTSSHSPWSISHAAEARSKAEAARHVNGKIVSVRYGYQGNVILGVWDEQTYRDLYFCTDKCAASFGYMAAREQPSLITQKAADAARARQR